MYTAVYRAVYTFPDGTLRPCAARYGTWSVYAAVYTAREDEHVYGVHWKSRRQLHVRVRAVHVRVDGRCVAAYGPCIRHGRYTAVYGPCTRPCNVSCVRYTVAVYMAREHVFARENGPYTAV